MIVMVVAGAVMIGVVVEMIVINRAEPEWQPGEAGTYARDGMFIVGSVLLVVVVGYIHSLIGPWPFAE